MYETRRKWWDQLPFPQLVFSPDTVVRWHRDPARFKTSPFSGSTIRTLLHGKINPKNWQVLSLDDVGLLLFFRVVSGDYGKPRPALRQKTHYEGLIHLIFGEGFFGETHITYRLTTAGSMGRTVYLPTRKPWKFTPNVGKSASPWILWASGL